MQIVDSPRLTQTLLIAIQGELGALLGTSQANAAWVITITLLTVLSSTRAVGGFPLPSESAFKWCFALGALAAFAGVAIAAFVPRKDDAAELHPAPLRAAASE